MVDMREFPEREPEDVSHMFGSMGSSALSREPPVSDPFTAMSLDKLFIQETSNRQDEHRTADYKKIFFKRSHWLELAGPIWNVYANIFITIFAAQ